MSLLEDNRSVLPAGLTNYSLVLKDEDGGSVLSNLEEASSCSESNFLPAVINVENSSDVIIGPVTQIHGPVTVVQSARPLYARKDGKLVKSEGASSEILQPFDSPKKRLHRKYFKITATALLILIVVAIVALTATISSKPQTSSQPDEDPPPYDPGDNDTLRPIRPGSIIQKKRWGGKDALNFTKPLAHPTHLVIISHSATPVCEDFKQCSQRVQSMQSDHVETLGSPDIGYNFVVGGDGNAYVGRDWDTRNFHADDSIGICFVGNYVYDYLTDGMIQMAQKLLRIGVRDGKLDVNYKLVAHNQTYSTISPGSHVYAVIKKWDHFDPSIYMG